MIIFTVLTRIFPELFKTEAEKKKEVCDKLPFKGAQVGEQYTDKNGNTKIRTGYYDYDN